MAINIYTHYTYHHCNPFHGTLWWRVHSTFSLMQRQTTHSPNLPLSVFFYFPHIQLTPLTHSPCRCTRPRSTSWWRKHYFRSGRCRTRRLRWHCRSSRTDRSPSRTLPGFCVRCWSDTGIGLEQQLGVEKTSLLLQMPPQLTPPICVYAVVQKLN